MSDPGKHQHVHEQQQQQQSQHSSDLLTQQQQQQFDPATAAHAADSVVPSLMQVYNNMAYSKTPEGPRAFAPPPPSYAPGPTMYANAAAAAAHSAASDWNAYAAATAAGGTSLPAIPPIPPVPQGKDETVEEKSLGGSSAERTSSETNPRNLRRKRSHPTGSYKEDSPTPSVASTGRSSKARKKAKDTDSRWSKRFSWPEDLHRDFVAAIFDVGLKHSSPSTILEHMPAHEQITSERVKSHLQKYRLHRIKSKREFMSSYDAGLKKLSEGKGLRQGTVTSLSAGEVASYLTHGTLNEGNQSTAAKNGTNAVENSKQQMQETLPRPATVESEDQTNINESSMSKTNPQDFLTLPRLTEAEKQSPVGTSMGYLLGLFFTLKQQLMAQRAAAQAALAESKQVDISSSATPAAAVYDSFVTGGPISTGGAPIIEGGPLPQGNTAAGPGAPAASTTTSTVVSNPSTRSNLEENNMMKREMQNQMAFQNKMRGLKLQELNKFRHADSDINKEDAFGATGAPSPPAATSVMTSEKIAGDASHQQGAGEDAGRRARGLSLGNTDEFWNTDVMDEQLFEFLMSEG